MSVRRTQNVLASRDWGSGRTPPARGKTRGRRGADMHLGVIWEKRAELNNEIENGTNLLVNIKHE